MRIARIFLAVLNRSLFVEGVATAGEVAKSPYGPDDEILALHTITDESGWAILSRIASGKVYDLSVDTFAGMPGLVHLGMKNVSEISQDEY